MLRVVLCTLLSLVLVQGQGGDYDHVPDYDWDVETMLDKYVMEDDGFFSWTILGKYEFGDESDPDVTVFVVNMTSQKWMDDSYSDRSIWWHWLNIGVPKHRISDDTSLFVIGGGNNRDPDDPPTLESDDVQNLANLVNQTHFMVAMLSQCPNQPITFTNDPIQKSRSEDDVIAWSWRTYLDMPEGSRDQSVILRAPMTKSAKRGLDAVNEILMQEMGLNVDRFIPSGGSKRGWTTWSLGAVDHRVIAMVPIVFSLLNMDASLMRHYQALDGWSFVFEPYYDVNITTELHNPVTQEVFELEDMFRYRSRLTMPKLLISATGDEFFLNHDTHSWWDGMTKPMHLWMVANAEHTLVPHYLKIYETLSAFCYMMVLDDGASLPELEWERQDNGTGGIIEAKTKRETIESDDHSNEFEVTAFRAVTMENTTMRDFRLVGGYPDPRPQPILWRSRNQELRQIIDDEYYHWLHYTENYDDEWVGHLIEVMFNRYGYDYYLSTEVNVIPDNYPVDECYAEECFSKLV